MASGERYGTIFDAGTTLGLGPGELLARFAASRDEAAFAALVARHGPMVLATCRRILPHGLDADDAFQATFLVLARRAGAIGDPDRLAPWLHGVARRVAARARAQAARRRALAGEPAAGELEAVASAPPRDDLGDLRAVLDEELARLPAKYRAPLVLCYLEGLTHDQAAGQLRWPVGTVRSRLAGGRDRLRTRLARRGLDPAEALAPIPLAAVPPPLVRGAVRVALGKGAAPAPVLLLARGASRAMTLTSPKTLTLAILLSLTLGGAAVLARHAGPPAGPIAQDPAAPPADPPPGPLPNSLPEKYPLTVTGRALDLDGQPIAGARITLASCSEGASDHLAEVRTDATGSYKFDRVLLPIPPDAGNLRRRLRGAFAVFGQADGFGFAWRPRKEFGLPRTGRFEGEPVDPPERYQPGEPILLDLAFPPPERLSGRATDEQGRPLVDARVRVIRCDRPGVGPDAPSVDCPGIDGAGRLPAESGDCQTDQAGRFALVGLPPGHRFTIQVRPRGFPIRQVRAATMGGPQADDRGAPVLTGPLNFAFASPRAVPVRVVAGDTGLAAPRVRFGASGGGGDAVFNAGVTDPEGRGELTLPPGDYSYELLPAIGTPYLVTEGKLTVPADGPVPPVEATLRPAVVLDIAAVDADTGAPLADVDLWEEEPPGPADPTSDHRQLLYFRSYEAATRICHVERPTTGADGKLRALIEPGPRRVGVGLNTFPGGRQAVEFNGQSIDGQPEETIHLTFPMRRRPR